MDDKLAQNIVMLKKLNDELDVYKNNLVKESIKVGVKNLMNERRG